MVVPLRTDVRDSGAQWSLIVPQGQPVGKEICTLSHNHRPAEGESFGQRTPSRALSSELLVVLQDALGRHGGGLYAGDILHVLELRLGFLKGFLVLVRYLLQILQLRFFIRSDDIGLEKHVQLLFDVTVVDGPEKRPDQRYIPPATAPWSGPCSDSA